MHFLGALRRMTEIPLVLGVKFFRTDAGNEPVREWLAELPREQRRTIGTDIKTVQLGGPIGMPVLRKLDSGLWEVRTDDNIERVIFTVVDAEMVLLHSFIRRARKLRRSISKPPNSASPDVEVQHTNTHIGSDFDDFLVEQGLAEEVSCAALKRVIAWQVAEAIKAQHISKKALAERMQTSRTVVDRALDQNDAGMTLATLASAWRFDWCRIPLTPGNRRQATIDYEGSRVNRGLSRILRPAALDPLRTFMPTRSKAVSVGIQ